MQCTSYMLIQACCPGLVTEHGWHHKLVRSSDRWLTSCRSTAAWMSMACVVERELHVVVVSPVPVLWVVWGFGL